MEKDLQEALHQSEYMGKHPILRRCMICKDFLDTKSEIIAQAIVHGRSDIEAVFSDGVHEKCAEDFYDLLL